MTTIAELPPGFVDKVLSAQSTFRSVMDAMARPGTVQRIVPMAGSPGPMMRGTAAIALTLFDHDTPLWLDARMAERSDVVKWLKFHTGAPVVQDSSIASFALISDGALLPALERFALGTNEYPDRSTTVVLAAGTDTQRVTLKGPGIKDQLATELPLPGGDFLAQWAENRQRFPRGVDLLLVRDGTLVGLPRTTRISEA